MHEWLRNRTRQTAAALLYLFPAEFRRTFGCDMLATFDDCWQERPGLRLAIRIVFDLVANGAKVRFSRNTRRVRVQKGDKLMTVLWQDLRFAVRMLAHSRGFTAVALATLALGIGVNTAMFSVANTVLWHSLPYPDPDRLVMVGEVDANKPELYWGASYQNLADWRTRSTAFEQLAGVMYDERILREGGEPVRVTGAAVSHNFFSVMGVAPAMGRVFSETEDHRGGDPVIVLSHHMWMKRFGGDAAILGRTIKTGTTDFTVVGVMPPRFEYRQAEFWIPLEQTISPHFVSHRNIWVLSPVGRLRPGATLASAQKEVEAIAVQIRRDYPETKRGLVVHVSQIRTELSRDLRPALLLLVGAAGFVLLIACGNLAGLMLVRASGRSREMAIRNALGVGWGRLVRQLLTESGLLAAVGGLAGVGLAFWATRSIGLLTKDPRLVDVHLDGTVLAFAAAVTAATTILFGVAPAIRAARVDASEALKIGGRAGTAPERAHSQKMLVVAEIALCLVLLVGAGLLLRSFRRVLDVDPGFRPDSLATMRVSLPTTYSTESAMVQFYKRSMAGLAAIPGTNGVTIASQLPMTGGEGNGDISIDGRASREGELGASTFRDVMPNYFGVMGIPLIRGRAFDDRDDGSHGRVVIINTSFARRFWPNEDPIGRRVKVGPRDSAAWMTIVGVVGDVMQIGLDSEAPFSVYVPLASRPTERFEVAVRAVTDSRSLIASVTARLSSLEPTVLIDNVQTMSQRIGETVAPRRLNLVLFGLFAGLALVLASVGIYGVVAYAVAQRKQEFGIRMALGAQPADVMGIVLRQGLKLALAGVGIGTVATLFLGRLITGLLFGVEPTDPLTLAGVALLLSAIAVGACWLPAYRATQTAPVETLRCG
jgi:putative ABC transport system permease protein